jgi:LisH
MALIPNDIYRLVHHYLSSEGFEASADTFANECTHLSHFCALSRSDGTKQLPRLIGPSLTEIIDEYFYVKDFIIRELQQLICCSQYRSHDSLLTLFRTFVRQFKLLRSKEVHSEEQISPHQGSLLRSDVTSISCGQEQSPSQRNCVYIGPEEITSTENENDGNVISFQH